MRKQLMWHAGLFAVTAALVAGVSGQASNPRFAKWKLKSDAPAPAVNIMTYEPGPNGKGMRITIDAVNREGVKSHWGYTTMFDGKDEPVTGNPGSDSAAVTIVDDHINTIVYKKGGKVTQILTNVLSPDASKIGIIYMRQNEEGKTAGINFATYERQP